MDQKSPTCVMVAAWLLNEIRTRGRLDCAAATALVLRAFGSRFVTESRGKRSQLRRQLLNELHRIGYGQIDHFYSPGRCRLWLARPA